MENRAAVLLLILLLAFIHPAAAAELSIPANTKRIEAQAFMDCGEISDVRIPDGVLEIAGEAFRNCAALSEATLPESLEIIGPDAFAGCAETLLIHCAPDSYAAQWAGMAKVDYDADTTYRALIIAQKYTGTALSLEGPANDAVSVRAALQSANDADDFNTQFISAFAMRQRGALNAEPYFVISASGAQEESAEMSISSGGASKVMGIFSYCLCDGLGWNGVNGRSGALRADVNADSVVSVREAAEYAMRRAAQYNPGQTAQYWPTDCGWFAPFRP